MFNLRIKRKQLQAIDRLSSSAKNKVKNALMILKNDPVPVKTFDVKKLQGYDSVYRIRVGNNRIVYSIDLAEKIITIQYIGTRKKAYK